MNIIDADQGNSQRPSLVLHEAVKMVLQTKMERLMARPIIASLKVNKPMQYDGAQPESSTADEAWISMMRQATPHDRRLQAIDELAAITPEGAWKTGIAIDYMDLWRGKESEIERQFESCLENMVVYLTKEQELLLRRTPREFLELNPRPQAAELLDYRSDEEGRVVELTVGAPPVQGMHVAVAIIPNLVQLQRQLDAVAKLMDAGGNKAMAPLRALLRLGDLPVESDDAMNDAIPSIESSKLDPAQRDAVAKALATPHFGIIQGPPGSGKTTVIKIGRAHV